MERRDPSGTVIHDLSRIYHRGEYLHARDGEAAWNDRHERRAVVLKQPGAAIRTAKALAEADMSAARSVIRVPATPVPPLQ